MWLWFRYAGRQLQKSARDLAPVILVILFFQVAITGGRLPETLNLTSIVVGLAAVLVGLTLFVEGLELGLFPVGEDLAGAFARKGSVLWLLSFSFALGFGTTVAEPALIAIADEAAQVVAAGGRIEDHPQVRERFAFEIRMVVAFAVGAAVVLGVLRILVGWSLPLLIVGGYVLVLIFTVLAPREIVGIAYDSGGVTTSTITVPLLTALGVGLSRAIKGRNPMTDGFGLIAFASLTPMLFVLGYGMMVLT